MQPGKQEALEEGRAAASPSAESAEDSAIDGEGAEPETRLPLPLQNAKIPPSEEEEETAPAPPSLERAQARQVSRVGAIAVAGIGASRPVEDISLDLEQAAAEPPPPPVAFSSLGSTSDESLISAVNVTATLVTDDEYEAELHRVIMRTSVKATNVETIEEEEDKRRRTSRCEWCLSVVCFFFIVVVLGTTLFLAAPGSSFRDNDDGVEPPVEDPADESVNVFSEKDLEQFLKLRSFDQGEALRDYNSPQRIALRYIAAEFPQVNLDEKIIDLYAVATLFFSTGGTFWETNKSWKSSSSVCTWYGIECDDVGHIVSINLHRNKLVGKIPPELALLAPRTIGEDLWTTGLIRLDLSHNAIGGGIPMQIDQLVFMKECLLNDNQLTGVVPLGMGEWVSPQHISLESNNLFGEVPSVLCQNDTTLVISVDCQEVVCQCCKPHCSISSTPSPETAGTSESESEGTKESNHGNDNGFERKR